MAQHSRGPSDLDRAGGNFTEMKQMGSDRPGSILSHTDHKRNAESRMSDLQVLQGIDSTEDPTGKYALR